MVKRTPIVQTILATQPFSADAGLTQLQSTIMLERISKSKAHMHMESVF